MADAVLFLRRHNRQFYRRFRELSLSGTWRVTRLRAVHARMVYGPYQPKAKRHGQKGPFWVTLGPRRKLRAVPRWSGFWRVSGCARGFSSGRTGVPQKFQPVSVRLTRQQLRGTLADSTGDFTGRYGGGSGRTEAASSSPSPTAAAGRSRFAAGVKDRRRCVCRFASVSIVGTGLFPWCRFSVNLVGHEWPTGTGLSPQQLLLGVDDLGGDSAPGSR